MLKFVNQCFRRLKPCWHMFFVGIAFAAFSLTPLSSFFEDRYGLYALFLLRGPEKPPAEIVVVAINDATAQALDFSDDLNQWPRSLHVELVKRLHLEGAELIGFNIFFGASRPEDAEFAKAIKESGAVLGADFFAQKIVREGVYKNELGKPTPLLADAMLSSGPSILMPGEETEKFPIWHGIHHENPTFVVKFLQYHLLKSLSGLGKTNAELLSSIQNTPEELLSLDLSEKQRADVLSWVDVYGHREPRYFNYYGPSFDIQHIPYQAFFSKESKKSFDLQGKLVIVGFSENLHFGNNVDVFDTPFSTMSSLDLMATAFANLLDYPRKITPAFDSAETGLLIFIWSVLLGLCVLKFKHISYCVLYVLVLATVYGFLASWQFNVNTVLLPFVLPVFIQPFMTLLACVCMFYQRHKHAHENAKVALDHMLPDHVVEKVIQSQQPVSLEETVGACMATDVANYTALAEKLDNRELRRLMDAYFKMLFSCVKKRQGIVSDVVGDAIMAYWLDVADSERRKKVLLAALDIRKSVAQFQIDYEVVMPIRIGLHCGPLQVGFYGGDEHSAFRATGDAMNVVSRIEGINKLLGTSILVSTEMMEGLSGFLTRPLGAFQVQGKEKLIHVFELLDVEANASLELKEMLTRFDAALMLCRQGAWQNAFYCLDELFHEYPQDGPIRFFRKIAGENHLQNAKPLKSVLVEKPEKAQWVVAS